MTPEIINVIVADDHALLRQGVIDFITSHENIRVVAEACDGEQLLHLVRQFVPNVVIMDIYMPLLEGREAAQRISREFPGIGIIALTMIDNAFMIADMVSCGARGYILKASIKAELMEGIYAVMRHEFYYCSGAEQKMVAALGSNRNQPVAIKQLAFTPRQREIIKLVCEGFSTPEIARKLHLGLRTVENYRSSILAKTGCPNSPNLVCFAVQNYLYIP